MNTIHETNQLDKKVEHPWDWDKRVIEMITDLNDMSEKELHRYFNRFRHEKSWYQRLWDWIYVWKVLRRKRCKYFGTDDDFKCDFGQCRYYRVGKGCTGYCTYMKKVI